jgi:hypothetical protein
MKHYFTLLLMAAAIMATGVQSAAAGPITLAGVAASVPDRAMPDAGAGPQGLVQFVDDDDDDRKSKKKRKIGAGLYGGSYWGYGLRRGDPCKTCAETCEENAKSARCKRCKMRCIR